MNYLAHLYLSSTSNEIILGNFLADMVKNKYREVLPKKVLEGIRLHRAIDSFTDQHELVVQGARRLYAKHSKYAPVLLDVFYDYLLVENWERYTEESLFDFKQRIYQTLSLQLSDIPVSFQARTLNMIRHDWLNSYTTLTGIAYTFERLKKRVSKPDLLNGSVESLQEHHQALTEEFNQFFPDVLQLVKEFQ